MQYDAVNGTYEQKMAKHKLSHEESVISYTKDIRMRGLPRPIRMGKRGRIMASKKDWVTGRLGYNSDNHRYGLLVGDLWEDEGFHCGETLEVMVDGEWVSTRMEMGIVE